MSCKSENFKKELHSGELNFSALEGNTLDEVLTSIETALEKAPFSVSLDSSKNEDTYQDSIKSLIETIIQKLDEKKNLPFELNRSAKGQIRKYLSSKLLPKPLTVTEKSIISIMPGMELITEDERRSIRLSQALKEIYGGDAAINNTRQTQFEDEIIVRTIINVRGEKGHRIIDSQDSLNDGLMNYQSELFKIIRDFLKNEGFDLSEVPQSLYKNIKMKDSDISKRTLQRNYNNAMQMMYNLIRKYKQEGVLASMLEKGWEESIFNNKKDGFYNAVNAYVNLVYFDDVLKEVVGEYISINDDMDEAIQLSSNGFGGTDIVYKYKFEKGNANAINTWGAENRDSLKEMSKFQQILIRSIPLYDYQTRSISIGRLQPKDFIGAISKLLDVGAQINFDKDFSEAVTSFKDHPSTSINIIFKRLFENENNKTLLESLDSRGIDLNGINFLYSIYKTVFKGKNSWKSIEDEYIKETGLTSRYSLIDTLLGVMDSNVAMNYAQTTYDHDTDTVKTDVKSRYNTNRTKFDIANNVNPLTVDRQNKQEILDRFKISTTNKKDYTVSIQGMEFKLVPKKNGGLLDKKDESNLDISNLPNLNEVNISDSENRRRFIAEQNLNQEEIKLKAILNFIDTMLDTTFSSDPDSLREFHLLMGINKKNLKEMFASASRALLVTDIYNKFENAVKPDGTKYSKIELLKFLEDSDIYGDKIQQYSDKRKKEYFFKRYDGSQLSSVRPIQKWIEDLAKVRAILSGDTSKSVISNLDGDKIPNFGPGYLAAKLESQLTKSNKALLATSNLLFAANPTSIKAKVVNTDVVTKDGLKKQIKNMTEGELLYDAIVNKFIVPFLKDESVYTQPTTYSDKTKFILFQVSLQALGIKSLQGDNFDSIIESKIIDTIGKAYEDVYKQVLDDYAKIFPEFVENRKVNLDKVQNWLKRRKEFNEVVSPDETDFDAILPDGSKIRYGIVTKAQKAGITVYKDVHYRQISGKKLSINELLYEYANNLFKPEALHKRLKKEKLNFINDLLSKRLRFEVSINDRGELDGTGNQISQFLAKFKNANSWIKGNKMVLAKVRNTKTNKFRYITQGNIELQENEEFIINPALNAFFMIDNLIGNNLRFSLTGSEINHKVKALAKLDLGKEFNLFRNKIQQLNPNYDGKTLSFYDVTKALENYKTLQIIAQLEQDFEAADPMEAMGIGQAIGELSKDLPAGFSLEGITEEDIKRIQTIYDDQIYKIENAAQNAQFKRNVIIPATMRYYLQDRLNGIRDKMKVAVINDLGADVFNFDGVTGNIDAHDGSAFINPFTSILENFSLQDCEVGTVKKPIHHWYDDKYMSATLLKYAVDTITNQWMRQSEGNQTDTNKKHGIVLRNLFKKMTNVRWHNADGSWKFGEIDLISGCDFRSKNPKIDFTKHIMEGKNLYYRDGLKHKKIHDFGLENDVYYTMEYDVDSVGGNIAGITPKKIYHYFQNDGTHVKSEQLLENPELHTIDSLFELHTALGGIYSESVDEEGNLQYSEASNYAVAQFINNVATLKDGADENVLTQESYYQPLKYAMIDVLANNSAVKNGAGNINPTSSFYDDTELTYIEIGTQGYGIQMDADHTADEGHMTEFSQVISSLDAGGRLHGYVSQIYETLGRLALDLSEIELTAVKEFRDTGNISAIYDVVGRTIINNLAKNRGQAGLANAIIDAIKQEFNLNVDHLEDMFHIPFSDANIYSTILSTFVSIINKKSIKRQYPGQGTVMVPGYNISMIYDFDGGTYQYEDLIKMAYEAGFTSSETDLSKKNRDVVQQFLREKQNKLPIYYNQDVFQPTDNVRISYNSNVSGTGVLEVSLSSIKDYYLFKDNIVAFLNKHGIVNPTNISFQKNIMVPRDLAPVKISWQYDEVPKVGNITIQQLINPDGTINWNTFEQVLNDYHNSQPDSRFAKGRYTLATREEKHFPGEGNTLNHIKFVTQSMLDLIDGKFDGELPFVSEARANLANQRDLLVLAAMFHDVAKPFRHGDIHGWESADILREIIGTNYNNRLAEWAVRHHMPMPFSHKAEFNLDNPDAISVAENIAKDALRLGIDKATAINAFVLINAADIINGRALDVEDNWAKKELAATGKSRYGDDISVRNVLTKELEEKVKLLSQAFDNVSKEDFGDTEYNYYNQEAFDYRAYPEGGGKIPFLRPASRSMNIFDHWAIKELYLYNYEIDQQVKSGKLSKKKGEELKEAKYKEMTPLIQEAFDELEKGIYHRSRDDKDGIKIYSYDENGNRQNKASNKAAEIIMSNIYKSKFNLKNGDSLADVMKQGYKYFLQPVTPIMSDNYDIVFTKSDNRNTYITFKPIQHNSENFDSTRIPWSNTVLREAEYPENYKGDRNIIYRIFAVDRDNIQLFEVGRYVLAKDVKYDKSKGKYVDSEGKVLPKQYLYKRYGEDKVLERIEFISKNRVSEDIDGSTAKYELYNINRNNIKRVLVRQEYTQEQLTRTDKNTGETYTITPDQKFDEEVNNFISHLLADVYHIKDFNGLQINSQVSLDSAYIIQNTLNGLKNQFNYDPDLSEYITNLKNMVDKGVVKDKIVEYNKSLRRRALGSYNQKLAQKKYISFLKSQEFTVSRIPAQTLQSFMQMRNVGFTGVLTNQCFVSHWQMSAVYLSN